MKRTISSLYYILLFFCLISTATPCGANDFTPVLTNYTSLDYGGGMQNWSIAQGQDGMMYFGNNNGLLSFDGYNWNLTPLPGGQIVRSLMVDGDRIYIGSYEQFGFFQRNEYGDYTFTSLWKKVKNYQPRNDEIWNIIKTSDGHILFQSFCSWFDYDGKHVRTNYDNQNNPLYFFRIKDTVYVQLVNGDFCQLRNNQFVPLFSREQVNNDNIVAAFAYDDTHVMLCSEFHGLFLYDGHSLTPFHTEIDRQLMEGQVNRATTTRHDGNIILGTIRDGLFEIDRNGKLEWHYSTLNKLHNNTVLGVFCDEDDNLWAALDSGIALIHRGSNYTLLTGPLGRVYDVFKENDQLYIATNQNTMLFHNHAFTTISGTQGQNWHISKMGSELVVGSNNGMRIINGNTSYPVNSGKVMASSTSLGQFTVNAQKSYLVESSYAELRIYENVDGKWIFRNDVEGFMAPVSHMEVDSHGIIWLANMNKGCYRIELNTDLTKVKDIRYIPHLDDKEDGSRIYLMKIRGHVVFSDLQGLYTVNDEGVIKPLDALNKVAGKNVTGATMVDLDHFWLSTNEGYSLISHENGNYYLQQYIPAKFFGLECGENHNEVKVFDNQAYFCMDGGIGRYDMGARAHQEQKSYSLQLRKAYYTDVENQRHEMRIGQEEAQVKGNVTLLFSYPNYNNDSHVFVFHLDGPGTDITITSDKPEIQFNNLSYGHYTATCEVKDFKGKTLCSTQYLFQYARPFWLSYPMLFVYLLLLGGLIYFFVRWRTDKALQKHIRQEKERVMKQELEDSKRQQAIEKEQKQQLEQELQVKGRELASLALEAVKDKEKSHDEEYWEIFRNNFDLIHQHFFRNLRKQYPTLTTNDLRFCAYLRLNLSTKDIASLTGLSIRGVEGARYRLRKKLNLQEGTDLSTFLIDFK